MPSRSDKAVQKHRDYMRAYYHRNKTKCNEYVSRYQAAKSKKLHVLKEKPCMDCGGTFPFWVMDFDHKRDKKFCIGTGIARKPWPVVLEEIAKCDLVCANCHRTRTHARRSAKEGGPYV